MISLHGKEWPKMPCAGVSRRADLAVSSDAVASELNTVQQPDGKLFTARPTCTNACLTAHSQRRSGPAATGLTGLVADAWHISWSTYLGS